MKEADASVYLDKNRPKKSGKCAVKIRITFNRKRKYFKTGVDLTPDEFETVFYGKRKTKDQKDLFLKVSQMHTKAADVINELKVFTFAKFEETYLISKDTQDKISSGFKEVIEQLEKENRLGTAESYTSAKNSLEDYKKDLTFADITPKLLGKYEAKMKKDGKSTTTIGIYLRSLRAVYNQQSIDSSIYPFGAGKDKYSIPKGKNIKKALTLEEIKRIYNYDSKPNSTEAMAKDYWIFLYLCNGMNVKDFCFLKWENIEGEMLNYRRAKTQRTKKESKLISVSLKPQTLEIIKKWGQPSISKAAFIFPHLTWDMDGEAQRRKYKQLAKTISKYIKRVCERLNIDKNVGSSFARHSFATVLKRSGTPTSLISELMGHSSVVITENYLDSFEKEHIQEQTDAINKGFNNAN